MKRIQNIKQEIYLTGINHRTAQVSIRECFAISKENHYQNIFFQQDRKVDEVIILSTCNRVEILVVADRDESIHPYLLEQWTKLCGQPSNILPQYTYNYSGEQAVRHLFTVASSLDSMILGEPQILGQLKAAYRDAVQNKTTGTILNRLVHKAFSVAKRVRTETDIASSAVSISYAAVELAKKIFGNLEHLQAMLIGAGEMAELAATHLLSAGVQNILIANRTFANAEELAEKLKGQAVRFENLSECLDTVDIIISSTGASTTILEAPMIQKVMRRRKNRPMFLIDIAVPRDIDPAVNSLDNVYLYDIDDLKDVVQENMQTRQDAALQAQKIVAEETEKFLLWQQGLDIKPTIVNLLEKAEELAYREIKKSSKQILTCQDENEIQTVLETLALSIARKICLEPVEFMKRKNLSGQGQEATGLIRRIFNLSEDEITPHIHTHRK